MHCAAAEILCGLLVVRDAEKVSSISTNYTSDTLSSVFRSAQLWVGETSTAGDLSDGGPGNNGWSIRWNKCDSMFKKAFSYQFAHDVLVEIVCPKPL